MRISGLWRDLARRGAQTFFPATCAACRRHVVQPGALCGSCWPKLHLLEPPWCAILGTPFSADMGTGAVSPAAIAEPPVYARSRAAASFTGPARDLVHALKYQDRPDLAPWMAAWMLRAGFELLPEADVIVPVPLHRGRFFSRRFNQSAELARALSGQAGLPYAADVLLRQRATRRQVGLHASEREANVRTAFAVPEDRRIAVHGRRILLVDDVLTTGATVAACSKALLKAKAAQVDVLTFARVLTGDYRADDPAII